MEAMNPALVYFTYVLVEKTGQTGLLVQVRGFEPRASSVRGK